MLRVVLPKLRPLPILVLLTMLVAGCALAARSTGPTPAPPTSSQVGTPAKAGNWQEDWEKTKAKAIAERRLVIASTAGPAVRDPLTKNLADEFGVDIEWVVGRNEEVMQRVFTEQRAGIYNEDIYLAGAFTIPTLKAQNALQSLEPVLFLPEVLDKSAWWGGNLLSLDKQRNWVAILAFPQPYIFINTEMVKPGEGRGWQALLDPKWKGQIVLYNPKTGAGLDWAVSVSQLVMSEDYLRQFAGQSPLVLGDSRQQCEWVARGKYPIAVAARTENMAEFVKLGAPVEIVSPAEGVHLTASNGGVTLFKNPPHPNAATVFANWALTKEGGTLISKVIGGQSARLDVPTDFLDQTMVRRQGVKYFNSLTEEYVQVVNSYGKTIDEIFGPLMK